MIPDDGIIKALVIDIHSFETRSSYWDMLKEQYTVVFAEQYPEDNSILIWRSDTGDARTILISGKEKGTRIAEGASELLNEDPVHICVVTGDHQVMKDLLPFPCITFGCGRTLTFSEAHEAPDYYLENEQILIDTFFAGRYFYPGEAAARGRISAAAPVSSVLSMYGFRFPLYFCGRYFGKGHFRYAADPYSRDLRKIMDGKSVGRTYQEMLKEAVSWICRKHHIDAILSVPPKPGEESKLAETVNYIAESCGLENRDNTLFCCRNYPPLSELSLEERRKATAFAFRFRQGYDYDKTFLILDDVVSTGTTFAEITQTLMLAGAEKFVLLAMAAAQNPVSLKD